MNKPLIHKNSTLVSLLLLHRKLLATLLLFICSIGISHANPRFINMQGKFHKASSTELTVSQYELALVQVLSEICPPMLNNHQRVQFTHAYQQQLRSFMPTAANPNDTLRTLYNQRSYRSALHNIRAWTATYPPAQNRKICLQFTEVEF
ncbi:hypothetical protein M2R47_01860 [Moraxella sp. Tifton1]|uniref:MCR_0457 family protein n=1 Tax=Moraxella oculi TaxID=2940516 RepID=A0ABW8U4P0_9GAMM|nr:hypothetical protein [Moraxella sp. Tifton1]MCL1623000.1 hypothetical protein [Moraxella sp. Tifton1]